MNNINCLVSTDDIDEASQSSGYEVDAVVWFDQQAKLLRARKFDQLDIDHLIEELQAMARRDRRELRSRLQVLVTHLLKCAYQPEQKSPGWTGTIRTQRIEIAELLNDSPSLRAHLSEYAQARYPAALQCAAEETGLPATTFPATLAFSPEQLLDEDCIP